MILFREALPRLDNYRLSLRAFKRPSISLLHGEALEHIPVSILFYLFFANVNLANLVCGEKLPVKKQGLQALSVGSTLFVNYQVKSEVNLIK